VPLPRSRERHWQGLRIASELSLLKVMGRALLFPVRGSRFGRIPRSGSTNLNTFDGQDNELATVFRPPGSVLVTGLGLRRVRSAKPQVGALERVMLVRVGGRQPTTLVVLNLRWGLLRMEGPRCRL